MALNISREDTRQRFDLVRGVARVFRIKDKRSSEIIGEVVGAVRKWEDFAKQLKWPNREVAMMTPAFRVA